LNIPFAEDIDVLQTVLLLMIGLVSNIIKFPSISSFDSDPYLQKTADFTWLFLFLYDYSFCDKFYFKTTILFFIIDYIFLNSGTVLKGRNPVLCHLFH
jgi:hypothetical protein